jgi:hypothetical protein
MFKRIVLSMALLSAVTLMGCSSSSTSGSADGKGPAKVEANPKDGPALLDSGPDMSKGSKTVTVPPPK